jgi:hypothetical protein
MAEFAHGHDAGHSRAAFDRVQVTLQADQGFAFARFFAQLRQQAVGMIEQVDALLDEDVDELGIQVREVVCFVGVFGGRLHLCERTFEHGLGRNTFSRCDALGFEAFALKARGFGDRGLDAFGLDAFGFAAFGFDAFGFGTFGFGTFGFGTFGFGKFVFGSVEI